MKENIMLILKGFALGIANVIPGVSGGTIAVILGIYEKLIDKETGLYLESPKYVYDLFKDEMNFGHIIQAEI